MSILDRIKRELVYKDSDYTKGLFLTILLTTALALGMGLITFLSIYFICILSGL
jgi:hypothetical protein